MRHTRANFWVVALASLALTSSVACQREQPADPAAYPAPGTPTAATEEARTDWGITQSVQARFYADDDVRGREIDVSTNDGVVTLRGTVESETARQQAVRIANTVEGVTRVDDQLQVATATTGTETEAGRPADRPTDTTRAPATDTDRVNPAWITTKIQAQYFVTPGIRPWNVDVTTTSDGVVTLRGEVESVSDRQEAVRIAREIDGVLRVEDHLRVRGEAAPATTPTPTEPAAERDTARDDMPADVRHPDTWLTAKIQSKYFLDEDVKTRNIDVDTNDGIVTLTGSVRSDAEKRQAVALARNTDGVVDVRDELRIEGDLDTVPDLPEARRGIPDRLGDGWITTKIQSQYFLDQQVKGMNIDVETRDGVVTLKGQVQSDAARQAAEAIAKGTEGVKRVVNQLTVTTEPQR